MVLMLSLIFALVVVFVLLVLAETLRRKKYIQGEVARKFVHITVGSFVATWLFFMPIGEVRLLCLAFLLVVLVDRRLKIFKSVHSVKRKTIGDIMFPLGILLATFITSSPWIFAVAILHLSLGDGFAAIFGQHFQPKFAYSILKQKKSFIGSAVFFTVSIIITAAFLFWAPVTIYAGALPILVLLPLTTTLLESLSLFGVDNVTVPVFVAIMLSSLQTIS